MMVTGGMVLPSSYLVGQWLAPSRGPLKTAECRLGQGRAVKASYVVHRLETASPLSAAAVAAGVAEGRPLARCASSASRQQGGLTAGPGTANAPYGPGEWACEASGASRASGRNRGFVPSSPSELPPRVCETTARVKVVAAPAMSVDQGRSRAGCRSDGRSVRLGRHRWNVWAMARPRPR